MKKFFIVFFLFAFSFILHANETLPPTNLWYFNQQWNLLSQKINWCQISTEISADLPENFENHLTTKVEYEKHQACMQEIYQLGCNTPEMQNAVLNEIPDCLFVQEDIYNPLQTNYSRSGFENECPFADKEFTFDHTERKFTLDNAYWMLWTCLKSKDTDKVYIKDDFYNHGFTKVEFIRKRSLRAIMAEHDEYIIFSFKGTTTVFEWMKNSEFVMLHPFWTGIPGRVHRGFYFMLYNGWNDVKELLLYAKSTGKKIIMAGHSMGGSLAQIAALKAMDLGITVDTIYTFSSPRTGNDDFVRSIEQLVDGRIYRVNALYDITPHMPPAIPGKEYAKDAMLSLFGDEDAPSMSYNIVKFLLDASFKAMNYTQAGDEYYIGNSGYFLGMVESSDDMDVYYWKQAVDIFNAENISDFVQNGPDMMGAYHSDTYQLCMLGKNIDELLYDW